MHQQFLRAIGVKAATGNAALCVDDAPLEGSGGQAFFDCCKCCKGKHFESVRASNTSALFPAHADRLSFEEKKQLTEAHRAVREGRGETRTDRLEGSDRREELPSVQGYLAGRRDTRTHNQLTYFEGWN